MNTWAFAGWLRSCIVLLLLPAVSVWAQEPAKNSSRQSGRSVSSPVEGGLYRNSSFGFSYKPPYGWVDRTKQMQDDSADPAKSRVLLATFERPPEASGDSINSAVIIATESMKSYPGLKTAADYFGPLTEVTTAKGFKVVNEPYEMNVGAKTLVRSDFSKELGKLTMHQASLVMLAKGYIVSFTFVGSSEDEVENLIGGLSFTPAKR